MVSDFITLLLNIFVFCTNCIARVVLRIKFFLKAFFWSVNIVPVSIVILIFLDDDNFKIVHDH